MTGLSLSGAELAKKVLLGGSVSAGAVVAYELLEIAKKNPAVLLSIVNWGPLFAIVLALIFLVDRRLGMGIEALQNNARAQQSMSDAVQKIAEKDDREGEELKRLTSFNAMQSEKVLRAVEDLTRVTNQVAVDQGKQAQQLLKHEFWLAQIGERVKVSAQEAAEPSAVSAVGSRTKGANA